MWYLQVLYRQPHSWRVHGCKSPSKRNYQTAGISALWFSVFPSQPPRCSLSLGIGVVLQISLWGLGMPQSLVLYLLMGCGSNSLLEKEASFAMRATLIYEQMDEYAEDNWKLYHFNNRALFSHRFLGKFTVAGGSYLQVSRWGSN